MLKLELELYVCGQRSYMNTQYPGLAVERWLGIVKWRSGMITLLLICTSDNVLQWLIIRVRMSVEMKTGLVHRTEVRFSASQPVAMAAGVNCESQS